MTGLTTTQKFRQVTFAELDECTVPPSTNTYQPIHHAWLYTDVAKELKRWGYEIVSQDLRLNINGDEFFGILRLKSYIDTNSRWDVSLGLRNTNNKRASVGVFLGTNVWVCDNLQFSAEHTFLRKHHAGTYSVLRNGIRRTCSALKTYRNEQEVFITRLQNWLVTPEVRDHVLVSLLRLNAVKANEIVPIVQETLTPSVGNSECNNISGWGLYNAVTYIGKNGFATNPETAASRSLSINKVFQSVI